MLSRRNRRGNIDELRIWRKHLKALVLGTLLTISIFSIYYLTIKIRYFDVSSVIVIGANQYVNELDIKEISSTYLQRKNIFTANTSDLRSKLVELFRGAKQIDIVKQLPNTVFIKVVERKPIAVFRNYQTQEKFIVDADGYVLGTVSDAPDYPIIDYAQDIKVGVFINRDLVPIYTEIIHGLDEEKLMSSSLSFFDSYTKVYLNSGTEVILSNAKSITNSLNIVKGLLENLENEKKVVKKIDLRYDKVIVLYD